MKEIRTQDAVGHILCHDITQIIPGEFKGARFRRGDIVREEDIPILLSTGKEHIYVMDIDEGLMHEEDAANILYEICAGENIYSSDEVKEGKIEAFAALDGFLEIDTKLLYQINSFGDMMMATRLANIPVKKGDKLAGMRVIPLLIANEKMEAVHSLAGDRKVLHVRPYQKLRVGVVTTGSEVYKGIIEDKFLPVLKDKLEAFGSEIVSQTIVDDKPEHTKEAILKHIENGADMVLCTGGMSVDPDDKTPLAIKNTGASIVTHGTPVLPGAMFMLAYYTSQKKEIPIMGLPGSVIFEKRTVFDILLPRALAGIKISDTDIYTLGCGGLLNA